MNLIKKIKPMNKISLYPLIKSRNIFFILCRAFKGKRNDRYKILYKSKNLILYPRSTLSLLRIYQFLNIFKKKKL